MKFTFFWKNVNKQLKSADFFSQTSKFQKSLLMKILTFFIVMLKHTLTFVVQQTNMKYLVFPITERIYVVIQKCKQINNFFRQLCNSQIVASIISKFTYFGKNVNKQLKSADFFAEM